MILSGLPLPEIKSLLVQASFNGFTDDIFNMIEKKCRLIPGGATMIDVNRIAYPKGGVILINDSVVESFKFKLFTIDFFHFFDNRRHKVGNSGFYRAKKILERWDERAYIECAVLESISILDMTKKWNVIHMRKNQRLALKVAAAYIYYFWNVTSTEMARSKFSIHEVLDYINIDKKSQFYNIHRYLAFRQPEELYHYFGLMSSGERVTVNKNILGDAVKTIRVAQRQGRPIPADAIDLFKVVNAELATVEKDSQDADVYRAELERIMDRIQVVQKVRESLEDIKKEKSEFTPVEIEKDEPFYPKK
jgi:hypothetical protein